MCTHHQRGHISCSARVASRNEINTLGCASGKGTCTWKQRTYRQRGDPPPPRACLRACSSQRCKGSPPGAPAPAPVAAPPPSAHVVQEPRLLMTLTPASTAAAAAGRGTSPRRMRSSPSLQRCTCRAGQGRVAVEGEVRWVRVR